jgi:putative transcriptional regulator
MAGDLAPLLLVSMPQMADPNFARSVVLLCDYSGDGAFGLVVNRPMADPAWTMIKTEPPIEVHRDIRLWLGGPVDPQRAWVLMAESQGPDDEQREVASGIILSASQRVTREVLQAAPSRRTRVIVGYAGWGPGQLEREIAASGWLTLPVEAGLIFGVPPEDMWETAIRRLGADPAALQMSPGVH